VSEGEIEGPIFWRKLRNDVDEREGADQQKHYQVRTLLLEYLMQGESGGEKTHTCLSDSN